MPKTATILLLGLADAGKTKILYHIKLGSLRDVAMRQIHFEPTTAFNYEICPRIVDGTQYVLHMWDLSGNDYLRGMWRHFYSANPPDAIIFVVDPQNKKKMNEAREAFQQLLHDVALRNTIKVVFINVKEADDAAKAPSRVSYVRTELNITDPNIKIFEVNPGHENIGLNTAMNLLTRSIGVASKQIS
jgi:ADP-ribosylation factor protein 1